MAHWGKRLVPIAGLAVLGSALAVMAGSNPARAAREPHLYGRLPGKPAYLWLWYADGKAQQPVAGDYCDALPPPPAFNCGYGTTLVDCQRQVVELLDRWYADFNLVLTLERPPTGDFYTIIVTSQGTWCDQTEAGLAPTNCNDNLGKAFAFQCGGSAHTCATIIAHEHGHLVGLEHTPSTTDVMNEFVLPSADGFDDKTYTIPIDVDLCRIVTQSSYESMLGALGPWPGGPKPSLFADLPDAGPADAAPDRPAHEAASSGSPIGPSGGIDSGPIGVLGGYDALVRPTVPTVDAALAQPKSAGGCSQAGPHPTAASILIALAGLLIGALIRGCGRPPGRPAPPAGAPLPYEAPARSPCGVPARARRW